MQLVKLVVVDCRVGLYWFHWIRRLYYTLGPVVVKVVGGRMRTIHVSG
jgi:hypothetical protein